jgi:hypothetical protein
MVAPAIRMTFVKFILPPLAKKRYQVVLFLAHEAVLFVCLPFWDALPYGAVTFGVWSLYFLVLIGLLYRRYYDLHSKDYGLFFSLERILILK